MRLLTGLVLGGILATGALGAAVSQTRTATGAPTTAPTTAAPASRTTDILKLMQQAADAAAKAKAAQARADAAKAEADKRAAEAAANTGAQAAQAEADRKAAEAKAVAQRQAAAAAQAEADKRAAIDKTRVPILLPTDAKLMAGARIYSFGDYYTITADAPGAGISLSGTTAVVPLSAGTPLKITPMGPEGATSQRTVDGQLVSFVRYGVLYTVEVRCDAPTDPRCVDDNYVRGLAAKTTAVVMGAAARTAAGLGG
jgi:cytoskeletal protein RodZ